MGIHASHARLKRELAAVSPMQSDKPKRDFSDFFKPYARHAPQSNIPKKRASPTTDTLDQEQRSKGTKIAKKVPKTPNRTVSFKDVTPSPQSTVKRALFSPSSAAALPIRSPKPTKSPTRNTIDSRQKTLFQTSSPPKPLRPADAGQNLNVSFTSDVSERSQSVYKDGKVVAVLDSDDDDDNDDDDNDSMVGLDELLGLPSRVPPARTFGHDSSVSSSQDGSVDNEAERVSILAKFTRGRSIPIVGKDKLREFSAKQRQLKFDLSGILDDHFGDLEAMKKVNKARAESDSEEGDDQALTETDKKLLADIVLNGGEDMDAEDVNRVLSAVERTEALVGEKRFSFFDWRGMQDRRRCVTALPFPTHAIPDRLWNQDDDEMRARAFLSGMMVEKAATGKLDNQALQWIFWEALTEQQSDLRHAYVRAVQAASSSWTRLHISAMDIQRIFRELGAAPEVLEDNKTATPKRHIAHDETGQNPDHLLAALNLLQAMSSDLDMSGLSKLSSILLRLCLDDTVMSDGRIATQVETLFDSLLDLPSPDASTHVYRRLLQDSTRHVRDHMLQAKLISRISVSNMMAAKLRKTLADVFLLGEMTLDRTTMTSNASLLTLDKHVNTHKAFGITTKLNATPDEYATLSALITILDVAIGLGSPPFDRYPSDQQGKPSDTAVRTFNASVDALADSIHAIFVSIKDTGASHMRRTEAKDALQALEYRCLYSVRIGVRKKKHVFDIVRERGGGGGGSNGANTSDGGEVGKRSNRVVGISGDEYRERERAREAMGNFLSRIKARKQVAAISAGGADGANGTDGADGTDVREDTVPMDTA